MSVSVRYTSYAHVCPYVAPKNLITRISIPRCPPHIAPLKARPYLSCFHDHSQSLVRGSSFKSVSRSPATSPLAAARANSHKSIQGLRVHE
jgi:hypothetical protein